VGIGALVNRRWRAPKLKAEIVSPRPNGKACSRNQLCVFAFFGLQPSSSAFGFQFQLLISSPVPLNSPQRREDHAAPRNLSLTVDRLHNKVKPTKPESKTSLSASRVESSNGLPGEKWLESLEHVVEYALKEQGSQQTARFLDRLTTRLRAEGVEAPRVVSTPYVNTIPTDREAPFAGDFDMERRIKSYVRWNAMAMVVNANREHSGLGGHISTYASAATLYEVAFNHFLRAPVRSFPATSFISRATPPRASTPVPSSKAVSTNTSSKTFARNSLKVAASPPIRIPI
jgi:hypothetical protein